MLKFSEMSKGLARRWRKRLIRTWRLSEAAVREMTVERDCMIEETPNGRTLDFGDGVAFAVSASGSNNRWFRYDPERAARGQPAFLRWVEDEEGEETLKTEEYLALMARDDDWDVGFDPDWDDEDDEPRTGTTGLYFHRPQ